jgi:zinc transport system ATP-binding protein
MTNNSNLLISGKQLGLTLSGRQILQNVDIDIHRGEIVTLIGPNGAGKTSLVRLVLNLAKPTKGSVQRTPSLSIGYMPQKLYLDASLPLSVEGFLALTGKGSGSSVKIDEALSLTGVEKLKHSPIHKLSGGETQRVLLARALLNEPDLLVLDEPVQGVDVVGQTALYQLIQDIRDKTNCGILMVSHDLHLVMAATDTVICLNQHVCCHGHPSSVSADPAYLEMFGQSAVSGVAVYTHHHDHDHDMHGDVLKGDELKRSEHIHTDNCSH